MHSASNFSERILILRKRARLTQGQVGDAVGVSQNSISMWERGESSPQVPHIAALARLFTCSADYLVGMSATPSGLDPDRWLVDMDEFEKPTPGGLWSIQIPRRARLVDYDELRRLESEVSKRKKGKR